MTLLPSLSAFEILQKPATCASCPENLNGRGFCPDWVPAAPKVAFLAERPAVNEIQEREPLVGSSGRLFTYQFLEKLGYTRRDVLLCNTIRCESKDNKYPTGSVRLGAEKHCRQYDSVGSDGCISRGYKILQSGGLDRWDPNLYIISVHPAAVLRTWSLLHVVQENCRKAFRFADRGYRPLVLLGDTAKQLVLGREPVGGVLKWQGHYGFLDWKAVKTRWQD